MGTGFDCFDTNAFHNRAMLRHAMETQGFKVYAKEWWHFTLVDEPYKEKSFDFPILKR